MLKILVEGHIFSNDDFPSQVLYKNSFYFLRNIHFTSTSLRSWLPAHRRDGRVALLRQTEEVRGDFLSLADTCPQDPGLETAWIVQTPLTDEINDATAGDPGMLIIRHDEQHRLNPDHQPVSAGALERQRQLLDRFRQA